MIPRPSKTRIGLWGIPMAAHLVNLDALIAREDFAITEGVRTQQSSLGTRLKLSELESTSLAFHALRKPDFQRETASWTPQKVMECIQSFLDGDLIPSIILWQSQASRNVFVIDGAHRLSALIAWVHDDYGDGQASLAFFDNLIPPEQKKAGTQTRTLIAETIGTYQAIKKAAQFPDNSPARDVLRAKNLAFQAFDVQWVQGDASKAEASFFRINQEAAPINETELRILQARRKPNALAARALIHAGTGHKYWSAFAETVQNSIETTAREVYDILFVPSLEVPIKTLDLPVAGRSYSASSVQLVFDFINFLNKHPAGDVLADDEDGAETVRYLMRVRQSVRRLSGNSPESLGLHPAVYFYSATGRYQPATFLGVVQFLEFLENHDAFFKFTSVRSKFEEFLLRYRFFVNQIVRKYGSGTRASPAIFGLYALLYGVLSDNPEAGDDKVLETISQDKHLSFLSTTPEYEKAGNTRFSKEAKSGAFLRDAIDKSVRCQICQARIHRKSISIDHIVRREDGGTADIDNAQLAHPYCNTGYKEKLIRQQQVTA